MGWWKIAVVQFSNSDRIFRVGSVNSGVERVLLDVVEREGELAAETAVVWWQPLTGQRFRPVGRRAVVVAVVVTVVVVVVGEEHFLPKKSRWGEVKERLTDGGRPGIVVGVVVVVWDVERGEGEVLQVLSRRHRTSAVERNVVGVVVVVVGRFRFDSLSPILSDWENDGNLFKITT